MSIQENQVNRKMLRAMFANTVVEAGTAVPDIEVTDITADSSRVTAGALFLACRGGQHHGLEFAHDAIAAGAAAIAWEPAADVSLPVPLDDIPNFAIADLGDQVGNIADHFFASPSTDVAVAGITGTNGKTTTAWLATQAARKLGAATTYMGTLGYGVPGELQTSSLTTPGVISVHRRLRELSDAGARSVVMEVSSHGLDQGRIDAVHVVTAAFTNLSRDHLDYHGSMAAYRAAKAKLFAAKSLRNIVINVGDAFGAELAANSTAQLNIIRVAMAGTAGAAQAELIADVVATNADGLQLQLHGAFGKATLNSPLWGRFNAENLLVAIGILLVQGFSLPAAATALEACSAPAGRMEIVRGAVDAPLVVIDFAHTPDALEKALQVVREHCSGSVTVVFGCGGERDQGKRGEMGQVARRLANRIIVTDDNPRFENPQMIIDEIIAGTGSDAEVVRDRAAAIAAAISAASSADAVLIAGKGSENYQLVAGARLPFSDAAVAAEVMGVQQS